MHAAFVTGIAAAPISPSPLEGESRETQTLRLPLTPISSFPLKGGEG